VAALRELYGAVSRKPLPKAAKIRLTTLKKALYMDRLNDLSFAVDEELIVLIEHQSTVNETIPMRMLYYVVRLYEKALKREDYYRRGAITIPAPVFIVLYNGKEPYPDSQRRFNTLKGIKPETNYLTRTTYLASLGARYVDYKELSLSSLFAKSPELLPWANSFPALELKVHVYNINDGRNPEMMAKSKLLRGYSTIIGKIREYEKTLPLKEAIDAAVDYCIENDVLKELLEKQSSEVRSMLFTEWNQEEALNVMKAEGMEIGEARGIEIGEARGIEIGRSEGRSEAMENVARIALAEGLPLEAISKLTGFDIETILNLPADGHQSK